ncbi:MAG: hypothetical protein ACR2O0_04630 [Rhizobiaceae bacterium]
MSDLKLAGSLIWALNKVQPISSVRPLSESRKKSLEKKSVECTAQHAEDSLLLRYHNEAPVFSFVYNAFCAVEARRREPKRLDFSKPIISRHFTRNFCFILRENSPGPLELYMIFKAFDLYGMELPANA